jgi:hypothetical protein
VAGGALYALNVGAASNSTLGLREELVTVVLLCLAWAAFLGVRLQQTLVGKTRNIEASDVGFADWIIGTASKVKGVETKAPANTLDWARFDKVWLA